MSPTKRITCPNCSKEGKVPATYTGTVRCSRCGGKLRVMATMEWSPELVPPPVRSQLVVQNTDPFAELTMEKPSMPIALSSKLFALGIASMFMFGVMCFLYFAFSNNDIGQRQQSVALSDKQATAGIGMVIFLMIITVAGFFSLALYLTPSIIAYYGNHPNFIAICVLNILTGWSFLGWVAAIVWAFTAFQNQKPVAQQNIIFVK